MRATHLYAQLETDFVKPDIVEDWFDHMTDIPEMTAYICDNYKQRSMGLLCDFAEEINKVYTAVFPSDATLNKILSDNTTDAMLFLHHPLAWDLSRDPNSAFHPINADLLKQLKDRRIALFNFHYPLDNFGPYATSKTLAEALGIQIEGTFAQLDGAACGVIGTTECDDIYALNQTYAQVVGHETKLYPYGDAAICNNRVGVCAGGGNDEAVISELIDLGINVLISGLSVKNAYSQEAHRLEEIHGINLLGGTHYSSEKYACIAMCDYFTELGLPSEFITDIPCFADL
ncbi:MAG: Nif3-like dinuclear metal center hexameric protein [Oscillospiraceae bacterium]|nr:Nif3-like dinuclear metal center hexameric protein [Oscillospiraceae bacterium]